MVQHLQKLFVKLFHKNKESKPSVQAIEGIKKDLGFAITKKQFKKRKGQSLLTFIRQRR